MLQAKMFDGLSLEPFSLFEDGRRLPKSASAHVVIVGLMFDLARVSVNGVDAGQYLVGTGLARWWK